jgi:hypothetical protein
MITDQECRHAVPFPISFLVFYPEANTYTRTNTSAQACSISSQINEINLSFQIAFL